MPFVRVHLDRELWAQHGAAIGAAIHQAQLALPDLGIPRDDVFQVFVPHDADELLYHPTYLDADRRTLVVIELVMQRGYADDLKARLFDEIVARVRDVGVRPDDILVFSVENGPSDWLAGSVATGADR